jgi:hypothetical protein
MRAPENDPPETPPELTESVTPAAEKAAAVGVVLADAFMERVQRYPAVLRKRLLIACHRRLLTGDPQTAKLLFMGK